MILELGSRRYRSFVWKEAVLRVSSSRADLVFEEIQRQRYLLEEYIRRQPAFETSLEPIELLDGAPPMASRMADAARKAGVGPMAAVAGAMAQAAAEVAMRAGADEALVDNGGDTFLVSPWEVLVGVYAGQNALSNRLALRVLPQQMPVSICSSSSRFGHSRSFGDCDLATILSEDGALADAAATLAGNSVRRQDDVAPTLERIMSIPGIRGVLIVQEGKIGLAGDLPELVRLG
jgi:uncharacterized protein